MFRHLVRATVGVMVASGSLMCLPSPAQAQGALGGGAGNLTDPFQFYYGVYLPNQQLQSMRPRPIDTLNQAVAQRQYYSQMDRRALYNPISGGDQSIDPLHPYSGQNQERKAPAFRFAQDPSNLDGTGPSLYYGRAAQYFPGLASPVRSGRAPNANVYGKTSAALRTPRALSSGRGGGGGGGGGGMGMGGMGGGMGGMGMGGMGGMM
jgi:hypothetical protein